MCTVHTHTFSLTNKCAHTCAHKVKLRGNRVQQVGLDVNENILTRRDHFQAVWKQQSAYITEARLELDGGGGSLAIQCGVLTHTHRKIQQSRTYESKSWSCFDSVTRDKTQNLQYLSVRITADISLWWQGVCLSGDQFFSCKWKLTFINKCCPLVALNW